MQVFRIPTLQVAYAWAASLGGEAGAALLKRLGLMEAAIEYAVEAAAFKHAFEFAEFGAQAKMPEIHYKYAMYLEDEGRFQEAEEHFIKVCTSTLAPCAYA